jgi:hypothetical protein
MIIGSLAWRIKNYGITATLRYIYTEKLRKDVFNYSTNQLITTLDQLNEQMFQRDKKFLANLQSFSDKIFRDISSNLIKLESRGVVIKKNTIGNSASKTRLLVLGYVINSLDFTLIIESGTQHAISASFMENFISKKCKIYSIDIKKRVIADGTGKINYVVLNSPVRSSFKIFTKSITGNGKLLYFHDSDHSFENMSFEFNWAWNELKANCLISDDVSENSAFSKFALKNNLSPYYCKFDSGSVVGLVLR